MEKRRKGRKNTLLDKLEILKRECDPNKVYSTSKLARILGLKLPNTRRYLRMLVNAGFILEFKHPKFKRYKYFRILTDRRIWLGRVVVLESSSKQEEVS